MVFIDGQNLFKQAQRCFGDIEVPYANYDPIALATTLTRKIPGGVLKSVRFFSGRPWAWEGNLAEADLGNLLNRKMAHCLSIAPGVFVPIIKDLAYRQGRRPGERPVGREKGVDVSMAINAVMSALNDELDALVILSQDRDLTEVPVAIAKIRHSTGRWIHLDSAFPAPDADMEPDPKISRVGIGRTRWITIDRAMYGSCLDQKDFRLRYKTGDAVPFPGHFEVVAHVRTTSCSLPLRTRAPYDARHFFPGCRSCGAPVFWSRFTQFRYED